MELCENQIMSNYLNPQTDFIFTQIFDEHQNLFVHFFNELLLLPADSRIIKIVALNNKLTPTISTIQQPVVNIECTDEQGRVFVVAIVMDWSDERDDDDLLINDQYHAGKIAGKHEIVANMLNAEIDLWVIAYLTGLKINDIKKIKKKILLK